MDATVIDRLAQAKVLVVGDILLDRFVEGKVSRISPEAPVPVLRHGSARPLLGGAGNVAANILSYGAAATLVGVTGDDEAADELAALCRGYHNLRAVLVRDPDRPTSVKTRYLSGWHQLLRVDSEETGGIPDGTVAAVVAAAREALRTARAVVLSDYAKGVLEAATITKLIAEARNAGAAVIVDPKKVEAALFAGATVLKPNVEEMMRFSGIRADSDEAAEAACQRVLEQVPIDAVVLTRGKDGMTLVARDLSPLHVRAENHRVFDVTGAGDTAAATLSAALAIGESLPDAVRLANTAAGIAVTKPGTAIVLPGELRRALGAERPSGVVDRAEAAEHVLLWKEQGLRVGFTNGCFDLLHRGHLYSLEQAARRVDRLVIGVNGDRSARKLKGEGRPVQDLATRAAVLSALRFVDLVVAFDEDTPEALIEVLSPNLLFKGADYAEDAVVGAEHVKRNGGRVELLPLLPGHSTTGTVERMRGRRDGEL